MWTKFLLVFLQCNKINIEALNKEVVIQRKKLGDLKLLIQDDIHTLSEKVARNNSEFDGKLDSITIELTKNKINFENVIRELKFGIEQQNESMSAYLEYELTMAKNDISELRQLTENLSKVLKTTQVALFVSIAITCFLVILIMRGAIMILENYKLQLIKEAKQIDVTLGQTSDFEKLVQEITDKQNDKVVCTGFAGHVESLI